MPFTEESSPDIQPVVCPACGVLPRLFQPKGRDIIKLEHRCSMINFNRFSFTKSIAYLFQTWNEEMNKTYRNIQSLKIFG